MSEFLNKRTYSPAARKVTELFTSSPEAFAEHEQRGLIATNNLGLRMLLIDAGPESELWQINGGSLLDSRIVERLERVKSLDPELWQESVAAYVARLELGSTYFSALQDYGIDDPRVENIAQRATDAEWRDTELRTKIFAMVEQELLTEEEAVALCR